MSFFSGGRIRDKDHFSRKSQFYVEFLGWMECRGLRGQRYTDPVMKELRRRQQRREGPPKLTVEVSRKDVRITQDVADKSKKGIKKVRFPTIPARDVTYVQQGIRPGDGRLDDTVACIYLGYMPRTQRYVHVHVYRFDEAKTATHFANEMSALVESNLDRIQEVETDLATNGEIDDPRSIFAENYNEYGAEDSALGSASSAGSDHESATFDSDEIEFDLQSMRNVQPFDSVTDELKFRLQKADVPLLLPPKDYDTIHRSHGKLDQINKRRCLNINIVGEMAALRERNSSNESGVDLLSIDSDVSAKNGSVKSPQHEPKGNQSSFKEGMYQSVNADDSLRGSKNNSLGQKAPASVNVSKQMLNFPGKTGHYVGDGFKPGHHSEHKSLDITPVISEIVYPPKIASPPTSPVMYLHPKRAPLNKQFSDNSKLHRHNDDGLEVRHYRNDPNNDIYAVPIKSSSTSSRTIYLQKELPPDYLDDIQRYQPVLRGIKQHSGHSYLSRALSDGPTRNEQISALSYRPVSLDLQKLEIGPQLYVSGSRSQVTSVPLEKISSSRRK